MRVSISHESDFFSENPFTEYDHNPLSQEKQPNCVLRPGVKGMVINRSGKQLPTDLTLWQQNPSRYYTRHHAHSHCYHNPGLITPSLHRDLVANDFRNYFYFANSFEQAAVCTWKWSLAKHGSAKWAMGPNVWDLIYFFGLCMVLSECGNLHQRRRKLFEGSLLSSRKEIICWMF